MGSNSLKCSQCGRTFLIGKGYEPGSLNFCPECIVPKALNISTNEYEQLGTVQKGLINMLRNEISSGMYNMDIEKYLKHWIIILKVNARELPKEALEDTYDLCADARGVPRDYNKLISKGIDARLDNKLEIAADYFKQAIDLYPDEAAPYIQLADAYWRLDHDEEALKLLDKAESLILSKKSKFPLNKYNGLDELHRIRGGFYVLKNPSKFIIESKTALKINPDNYDAIKDFKIFTQKLNDYPDLKQAARDKIKNDIREMESEINNLNNECSKKFKEAGNIAYTKYQKSESKYINMPEIKNKLDAVVAIDLLINKANQEIEASKSREKKSGFFAKMGDAVTSTAKIGKLKIDLYNFGKKKDSATTEFGEQLYASNKTGTLALEELSSTWQRVDELKKQIDVKKEELSYLREFV